MDHKYENRLVILLALAWGFVFLDRNTLAYLGPVLTQQFNLNNSQVGLINMWMVFGYGISAIFFAMMSDKTGYRKRWLVAFVLLTSFFSGLSAAATTFMSLIFIRFFTGATEGPILPTAMTMVSLQGNPKRIALNAGIVDSGVPILALSAGPIIVTQLSTRFSWHTAFIVPSVASLIMGLLLLTFTKEVDRTNVLNMAKQEKLKWSDFGQLARYRNVIIALLLNILNLAAMFIMIVFGPLYWVNVGHMSEQTMGYLASAMGIGAIAWVFIMPMIADRIGRKRSSIIFMLLSAIPYFSLFLAPGGMMSRLLYVVLGGIPTILPILYISIIGIESVPPQLRATSSAVIMAMGEIVGGAFGPRLAGSLADQFGLASAMFLGAGACVLGVIISFGLIETKLSQTKLLETPNKISNPSQVT